VGVGVGAPPAIKIYYAKSPAMMAKS